MYIILLLMIVVTKVLKRFYNNYNLPTSVVNATAYGAKPVGRTKVEEITS